MFNNIIHHYGKYWLIYYDCISQAHPIECAIRCVEDGGGEEGWGRIVLYFVLNYVHMIFGVVM
jgi:hypothetical protein